MSHQKDKLLPCPFCGKKPRTRISDDKSLFIIECRNCAPFIKKLDFRRYRSLIIEEWNTRAKSNEEGKQ